MSYSIDGANGNPPTLYDETPCGRPPQGVFVSIDRVTGFHFVAAGNSKNAGGEPVSEFGVLSRGSLQAADHLGSEGLL